MRTRLAPSASLLVATLLLVPACKSGGGSAAKDPVGEPVAVKGTGGELTFKHGSSKGPGTGGGEKDAVGEKIGAGGFKHGSKKGGGTDGGKQDGSGLKSAKQPAHESGKGTGTGGGKRDGSGDDLGVRDR